MSNMDEEWPNYLNETILNTLKTKFKFNKMTPVQSVVLPIFIQQHKDVVVEAITGSGKTLAFVIPILQVLLKREEKLKKHDIGALIISPTRELAIQIFEVLNLFLTDLTQFTCISFVGGTNPEADMKQFIEKGGNIVVSTAGRLEDLLKRKSEKFNLPISLKSLEILILDEADRLLELGFQESINAIFQVLPKQRRTGLFSATQTDDLNKLIKAGLRNPCQIQVKQKGVAEKQKTPVQLNNYYVIVNENEKFQQLILFLKKFNKQKHLIFMSTCACVQYFSRLLKSFIKNTSVLALHRKLKDRRNKIFVEFKRLQKGILVCTDVMSRGIDITDVDWVIQYDLPSNASAFVHRCGRTARLERIGNALVFLLPNEDSYVNFIKINQNVPLESYSITNENQSENAEKLCKTIQIEASKERELYEKGKEAFVSYIRAYSKHECSYLLRVKELNFGKLAQSFGLLHLPKMPELKKKSIEYNSLDINYSQIPYKDKHKESERQKAIANGDFGKKNKKNFKQKSIAWSNNVEKKLKRKIKREKKEIVEKKLKRKEIDEDELDELQEDFKLLKKLKKKKISEQEFDSKFLPSDDEIKEET